MAVSAFPSPKLIEVAGKFGELDGVWIDQEHSGLPNQELELLLMACRAAGLDAFARVAPTDYATVMRPMEGGASGVMMAQVRSVPEVEKLVRWMKYHPEGERGLFLGSYEAEFGAKPAPQHVAESNRDRWTVIQIETAEQHLYDLATAGEYEGGFKPFKDTIIQAIGQAEVAHKREGKLAGVTTGFRDMDALLGGLHKSDLLILAGRPAMGKTALATNVAFNAAYTHKQSQGAEGAVVGFFSLEMSSEQLAARILSEQSNISSNMMRKGELTDDEFSRLVMASQTLHQIPIFIDDTPALTVSALRTRARRLKRQQNLGLIVVDYLQLISGSAGSRNDGRVQEVSEITRGLKTLAKELDVPVLALSQLSRQVENREDKRPQLADLRESGSIEQDADLVMFIYRDEYYLEKAEPKQRADESGEKLAQRQQNWEERLARVKNTAEVIVAKQRHGPVGMVRMMFDGQYTRFGDLDQHHADSRYNGA